MKLAHLVGVACVMLALFTLSCTNSPNQTTDDGGGEAALLPVIANSQVVNDTGDEEYDLEADSIALGVINSLSRYEVPVTANQDSRFCGGVTSPSSDTNKYRITFFFIENGGSKSKKIGSFKISGIDVYNFSYKAPAAGKVQMVVEQKHVLAWKDIPFDPPQQTGDECCDTTITTKAVREKVSSNDGSGGGTSGQTEQ